MGGIYLSSYTTRPWSFTFCYAGISGLGNGMCFFVPFVCAMEYFPNKKGLLSGIIFASGSFGAFIFNELAV